MTECIGNNSVSFVKLCENSNDVICRQFQSILYSCCIAAVKSTSTHRIVSDFSQQRINIRLDLQNCCFDEGLVSFYPPKLATYLRNYILHTYFNNGTNERRCQ